MNLIYISFFIIFNFYFQPVDSAKPVKVKHKDVMVNGDCANFDTIQNFCRDEAELKYNEMKNKNQCCILNYEIECLEPFVNKVCAQHRFFENLIKDIFKNKKEFKNLQCGAFQQYECLKDGHNIWILLIGFFVVGIGLTAGCIICFSYIQ